MAIRALRSSTGNGRELPNIRISMVYIAFSGKGSFEGGFWLYLWIDVFD